MNEHLMLEMARQRNAEQQEIARLARLAREQRAADREQRAADREQRCRGGRGGGVPVPAQCGEMIDLPPIPDYVDGTFAR